MWDDGVITRRSWAYQFVEEELIDLVTNKVGNFGVDVECVVQIDENMGKFWYWSVRHRLVNLW